MKSIEPYISTIVKEQFPAFYKDSGPLFIAFVKAYYEWMESNLQELIFDDDTNFNVGDTITQNGVTGTIIANNDGLYLVQLDDFNFFSCIGECDDYTEVTSSSGGSTYIALQRKFNNLYLSRKLPDIRDIDKTLDQFILFFKEKYLSDIQFTTASNKQLFVKNALDFYRAKGTERAVDLFFKLIHGFEAKVYYPGNDIFKPSDNEWVNVIYLEIEPHETNLEMINEVIEGGTTGTQAYVERLVRIKNGSLYITVLHLSNITGDFQTGEQITTKGLTNNVTSRIVGSFADLEIILSDTGFEIGESLTATSGSGKNAQIEVTSTVNKTGVVEFELVDGGWGYTQDAEVIGSDYVFLANNVSITNDGFLYFNDPVQRFGTIRQDLVEFELANTGDFEVGDILTSYDANNDVNFTGEIMAISGQDFTINYDMSSYANIDAVAELWNVGNTFSSNVNSANDVSASANVIACGKTHTIQYTGNTSLLLGDVLYQNANVGDVSSHELEFANAVVTLAFANGYDTFVNVTRDTGCFRTDYTFFSDDEEFSIVNISNTEIAVIDVNNTFYRTANTYEPNTGTTFDITTQYTFLTKADVELVFSDDTSTISGLWSNTIIDTIPGSTYINAYANDAIANVVSFEDLTVGSIDSVVLVSPGQNYSHSPYYIIYDYKTAQNSDKYGLEIRYEGGPYSYIVGETLTGGTSGATAKISEFNKTTGKIIADRTSIENFQKGELMTGSVTNITSTVAFARELRRDDNTIIGMSADLTSTAFSGDGYISGVRLINSGFGYIDGETITFANEDGEEVIAKVILGKQGVAPGYFTSRRGFTSSDKYIHDNNYYQEYSYKILTSLPFDVYKDTLKKVLHVAGTKMFGSYFSSSRTSVGLTTTAESRTTQT